MDAPKKRDDSGHFLPGNKEGNGRPRMDPEIRELLRGAGREVIEKLLILMRSAQSEKVQAQCANSLADRIWGKAPQAITDEDGNPLRLGLVLLPPEGK